MQANLTVSRSSVTCPRASLHSDCTNSHRPRQLTQRAAASRVFRVAPRRAGGARRAIAPHAFAFRRVTAVAAEEEVFVEEISNENAHVSFKVQASPAFCKTCYDDILAEASQSAEVPGFRKGAKIPENTLVGFLGGKREVKRIAVERVLRDSLPHALKSVEKTAIADSEKIESNAEELIDAFDVTKPLIFQVGVDLPPKVQFTRSYKGMKIEVQSCSSPESEEQTVEDLILQGRKDKGNMRIATGRGMTPGDVVVLDMDVFKQGTDQMLQGGSRKKYQIDTGKKNSVFLPGVIEGMLGMEVGDVRTIPVTFPQNWQPPQLAGLSVDARIKLRELFEYELAPEDDSLAGQLYKGAKDMIDLRLQLASAVSAEAAAMNRNRIEQALAEELVKITDADLPWQIVQEIGQQMYQRKIMEQQTQGQISPEVMEKLLTPAMLQNYIKTSRKEIDETVKAMVAIETIFAAEKMVVTEEEKEAAIDETIRDLEKQGMEYDAEEMMYQAGSSLMQEKVIAFLIENSEIVMLPYNPDEEDEY